MKLIGEPNTTLSTPHGMVHVNRNGIAEISSAQADFINERIEAGSLPGYSLNDQDAEDKPEAEPEKSGGKTNKKAVVEQSPDPSA
ncbi:MAG: hypothetical protein EPN17_00970 [Methylobacter sp.]|nr:MAG: hypothetical protein EPN17_00970 [Methylobacter sp.]